MRTIRTELKMMYRDFFNKETHVETRRSGMSLSDIETAIYNGYTVYWKNRGYEVIKDKIGQYLINCKSNSYCVGLTRTDGSLIEDPKHFFLGLEH